jgi:nucleoid-associated protein YgaU
MADTSDINAVETEDDYIHVQFQDPDRFEEIRTPDWAANAAQSVSEGALVRTGRVDDSDDWEVETVLIKKSVGEDKAKEQATEIVEKIES